MISNGTSPKSSGMRHDIRELQAQVFGLSDLARKQNAYIFNLQQAFTALQAGLEHHKVGIWPFRRSVLTVRDMDEALHELKERKMRQDASEEGGEVDTTPIPPAPNPGPIQRYVDAINGKAEPPTTDTPPSGKVPGSPQGHIKLLRKTDE